MERRDTAEALMGHVYICTDCRKIFESGWSDTEAQAEFKDLWPGEHALGAEKVLVCDDCFRRLMATFN